jgi:hypothetical protein
MHSRFVTPAADPYYWRIVTADNQVLGHERDAPK